MRTRSVTTACAAALGAALLQPVVLPNQAVAADDAAAICKASIEAYMAAVPTGDAVKLAATFTPNGDLVTPFGVLTGREAMAKENATWMKAGDKDMDKLIASRMIGDAALCHGSYVFTPAGGGAATKGYWTKIARKVGDEWKIDVLVYNNTPPD